MGIQMKSIIQEFKQNLTEQTQNVTVLFPGGFKPITGAHLALANRYAENPSVQSIILLIGPKERDGFTRTQTIDAFNLMNSNPKIRIQPTEFNSPIMAAYEYLFALPEDTTGQYAMAASAKGDDYIRTKSFVPNVDKYKITGDKKGRKIPQGVDAIELTANADPITYPSGEPISATATRAAISDGDYNTFKLSYPGITDEILKNVWEIFTGKMIESTFSREWWTSQMQEDINAFVEGYMDVRTAEKHKKKIEKLRKFLNNNTGKEFVYDFDTYDKTTFGVPLKEIVKNGKVYCEGPGCNWNWNIADGGDDVFLCHKCGHDNEHSLRESTGLVAESTILTEGGAAGHMAHPYDDHGLTFNEMKELISRALEGQLDIEEAVTEKTDGQNLQVTWKNGQVGFSRNKGTIVNPLSTEELISKFEGRGDISDAFREAGQDLQSAFNKVDPKKLDAIFKNGTVFANMEIIYPATKNIINYDKAHIQFHNLIEYRIGTNAKGKPTVDKVQTDMTGGTMIQKIIEDANAHMQNTFSFIPPQKIKLGRMVDFEDQQSALFAEVDQLKNQFELKETDLISEYHRAWWRDVISTKAEQLGYDLSDDFRDTLVDRWAFDDKSTSIIAVKKQIESPEFVQWVDTFDKKDFKSYQKQNMEPFESIFLRLGAIVLSNVSQVLAADPSKSTQEIKRDIATVIKQVQQSKDPEILKKVETQLKRIEKLGGLDKIVPIEGIVFTFKGNTYKLTGAFAPVNQLIGILKFGR